jgi:hypothetical protein
MLNKDKKYAMFYLKLRKKRIEKEYYDAIQSLIDDRMELLSIDFKKKFPKAKLEILFGNGSEFININGKQIDSGEDQPGAVGYHRANPLIREALEFVWDVTEGYRRGSPNDIKV